MRVETPKWRQAVEQRFKVPAAEENTRLAALGLPAAPMLTRSRLSPEDN
jgi:hypothetical protein